MVNKLKIGDIVKFPQPLMKIVYEGEQLVMQETVEQPCGAIIDIQANGEEAAYVVKISESFGSVWLREDYLLRLIEEEYDEL